MRAMLFDDSDGKKHYCSARLGNALHFRKSYFGKFLHQTPRNSP
jgi:hypothetical protein